MTDIDAARPLPGVAPRIRSRTGARSRLLARIGAAGFHPAWWVALAAAAAWYFVAATHAPAGPAPHAHGHAGHGTPAATAGAGYAALVVMTIAMMLPLTLGRVRDLARSPSLRHPATAAFLAGYLGVWMIAIGTIALAWNALLSRTGWIGSIAGVTVAAVAWEVAAAHPRLRRCDSPMPPVARGWRAVAASGRSGVVAGGGCVLSCWAVMMACVALAHALWAMILLFVVQVIGRYRPSTPVLLRAAAVLIACIPPILRAMP